MLVSSTLRRPCHFPFCSYHSFLLKRVRITHVGVSVCVCVSGQQPLSKARARCVETPKLFLVVRLPSDAGRGCRQAICTPGSDQVAQPRIL